MTGKIMVTTDGERKLIGVGFYGALEVETADDKTTCLNDGICERCVDYLRCNVGDETTTEGDK
jgi:hypothetical protein